MGTDGNTWSDRIFISSGNQPKNMMSRAQLFPWRRAASREAQPSQGTQVAAAALCPGWHLCPSQLSLLLLCHISSSFHLGGSVMVEISALGLSPQEEPTREDDKGIHLVWGRIWMLPRYTWQAETHLLRWEDALREAVSQDRQPARLSSLLQLQQHHPEQPCRKPYNPPASLALPTRKQGWRRTSARAYCEIYWGSTAQMLPGGTVPGCIKQSPFFAILPATN